MTTYLTLLPWTGEYGSKVIAASREGRSQPAIYEIQGQKARHSLIKLHSTTEHTKFWRHEGVEIARGGVRRIPVRGKSDVIAFI